MKRNKQQLVAFPRVRADGQLTLRAVDCCNHVEQAHAIFVRFLLVQSRIDSITDILHCHTYGFSATGILAKLRLKIIRSQANCNRPMGGVFSFSFFSDTRLILFALLTVHLYMYVIQCRSTKLIRVTSFNCKNTGISDSR
jgi:hypothetical protein